MTVGIALVLVAAAIAAVTDLRTRRVPNALVVCLLVAGFVVSAAAGWWAIAGDAIVTCVAVLAGSVLFSLRLLGGGDVKFFAAAAGVLGYPDVAAFLLYTTVAGGVLALAYAGARGRMTESLAGVRAMALPLLAGAPPARITDGLKMPYAVAIFAGALCLLAAHTCAPFLRIPL